jgi:hypothetical protein
MTMSLDQEGQYVAELARLSSTSVSITMRIVEIQLAMMLRDLGVHGEAQTLLGKVRMNRDGNLILENPNSQINKMKDKRYIVNKLLREIGP